MRQITAKGKTIDDAIQHGLQELQVPRDEINVEILEQPSNGFLGLFGVKEAQVRLTWSPDPLLEGEQFLNNVLTAMNLNIGVTRHDLTLEMSGDEVGIVIGRRGQTLDALQLLVNLVVNKSSEEYSNVILDAENFRERREVTLQQIADRTTKKVLQSGKEVELDPMSAHDRKVIHFALQDHPKIQTFSRGNEPHRRVVLAPRQ